jgi:WD40-like Beta Propeller Repeat
MRVVFAVVLAMLVAAPCARADTIVFRRDTDVWRMAADGSGQRPVASGGFRYEWPSAADDGTIVASDETGRLHRLARDGAALGEPIPTAATGATQDAPAETPTHVRISPDGTRIAYDQVIDGDPTTLWTPASSTGLEFPGQALGQAGMVAPSWIGNDRLLLSRDVTADEPGAISFSLYGVGGGDDSAEPWFSDDGAPWATGHDAAASRAGTRLAVLEDDAADHDGAPQRVALRLFAAAAPAATPEFRCQLDLEAADTYASTSPTFSPNGTRIAWAESDGIHVAALGALDDCAAIREQVVTLPGAWEPHWSPAAEPPPAAGTPAAKLRLAVSTRSRPHRATLRKRGLRARITVGAPTTVRLSVRVAGTKRFAGTATRKLTNAGTTTVHLRLRGRTLKNAKRLILRVSAPGATPVAATIRPRT